MNNFDWNQFEPVNSNEKEENKIDWNKFEKVNSEEPSKISEGIRHVARTGSDIASTLAGLPGDMRDFLGSVYGLGEEYFPESISKPMEKVRQSYESSPIKKVLGVLPTSSELRKKAEERSEGYLKPKTKAEENASELVHDITSFFAPGTGKLSFVKKLGIPLLANLSKEGIRYAGGTEKQQAYTKLGVMLPLVMMNPGGAKKHAESLFQKSEALVPENAFISTNSLTPKLKNLEIKLQKGRGASEPSKAEALTLIKDIEKKIVNNKIPVHEAIELRKDINKLIKRAGGFDIPKDEKISLLKNINEIKNGIISTIEDYGVQNPQFGKLNRAANESFAVIENSNRASRTIEKALKKPITNNTLKILLGISPYIGAGAAGIVSPVAAAGTLAGVGSYNAIKLFERIRKSPELRKYYQNVLIEGMKENVPAVTQNLQKLDKKLEKKD